MGIGSEDTWRIRQPTENQWLKEKKVVRPTRRPALGYKNARTRTLEGDTHSMGAGLTIDNLANCVYLLWPAGQCVVVESVEYAPCPAIRVESKCSLRTALEGRGGGLEEGEVGGWRLC